MYISLRNYLRIKECLKPELYLDVRKNLVLTNIHKAQTKKFDYEHNERMNVYIKVDKDWVKKARESVKYYSLFRILADRHHKLKIHLFLKCAVINIE